MKSRIRDNIIANEKMLHGKKIETQKLYDIIEQTGITKQNIADMFQLSNMQKCRITKREGKVTIKLYNIFELQEIREEIRRKVQDKEEFSRQEIRVIQNYYKLSDKEIRILFNISLYQLKKLDKNENYKIKNKTKKNSTQGINR